MNYLETCFLLSDTMAAHPCFERFVEEEDLSCTADDLCLGGVRNLDFIDLIADRLKERIPDGQNYYADALEDFAFSGSLGTLEELLYELEQEK